MSYDFLLLQADDVASEELDKLALVLCQMDLTHEARYSQLLNYFKQVNLCVQLLLCSYEESLFIGELALLST